MNYPSQLVEHPTLLLPGSGLGQLADSALKLLYSHGFVAGLGLTAEHAQTIVGMAGEDAIKDYCPNDTSRFADAEAWIGKDGGRGLVGIYDVVDNNGIPLTANEVEAVKPDQIDLKAYGWSGRFENQHIQGANVTTAYRVGELGRALARYRRERSGQRRFGLGPILGELVVATAINVFDASPKEVSLEYWDSNEAAKRLYDDLGFRHVTQQPDVRPTTKPVGSLVNGQVVYLGENNQAMVQDTRMFRRLVAYPISTTKSSIVLR